MENRHLNTADKNRQTVLVNDTIKKTIIANSLPESRNKWAHERTRLAKERTFAAWLRSGLATVGVGLGLVKLFPKVEPRWLMQMSGLLFICAGGIIFVVGYKTYHTVIKKMEKEGFKGIPSLYMGILTIMMLLGAISALIIVLQN